jgi:hypothetical protein
MALVLVSGIGVAVYLLIGLVLLAWIDYDYQLFPFIAECPVPTLELVLLFGWPVLLSTYGHRQGWWGNRGRGLYPRGGQDPGRGVPQWPTHG